VINKKKEKSKKKKKKKKERSMATKTENGKQEVEMEHVVGRQPAQLTRAVLSLLHFIHPLPLAEPLLADKMKPPQSDENRRFARRGAPGGLADVSLVACCRPTSHVVVPTPVMFAMLVIRTVQRREAGLQ
jgi:hypothetical protein